MKLSIAVISLAGLLVAPLVAQSSRALIVQTNSAGDSVTLIDPATDKIVAEIPEAEVVHGAAAAPDGSRLYLTNEATEHARHRRHEDDAHHQEDPLDRPPEQPRDSQGRPARLRRHHRAQGGVDVIDTVTQERTKTIPILRRRAQHVHHAGQQVRRRRLDRRIRGDRHRHRTERAAWSIHFEGGVRPLCFETNPDGSTKRMFVQITNLHGFAIVDWAQRKEVGRINLPDLPPAQRNSEGIQGAPAHGILIAPDGKTLWSTSKFNSAVYAYSMPDLKYLGEVKVGKVPDWLTFTPDSKKLYVANAHDNTVSVIDVAARKELTKIKVGQVPKRNITAILPAFHDQPIDEGRHT